MIRRRLFLRGRRTNKIGATNVCTARLVSVPYFDHALPLTTLIYLDIYTFLLAWIYNVPRLLNVDFALHALPMATFSSFRAVGVT
jgi:hypothetical protein